jgi:hypothetical protein
MYVELKSGYHDNGPAWIGRVAFSKTGRTIYYRGKSLRRIPGGGIFANHRDIETGEEYWVSGVKKNGEVTPPSPEHPGGRAVRQSWSARRRIAFLVVGLVPTLWLTRQMPIGFFYMAGGWTMIISALAAVPIGVVAARNWPARRSLLVAVLAAFLAGAGLLAMTVVARADARGQHLPVTDWQARAAALGLQGALAGWAVVAVARRRRGDHAAVVQTLFAYGASIATVALGVMAGRRLPVWFIVPLVSVVAARFAVLPLRDQHAASDSRPSLIATTLLFTSTVAVLVLQGQLLRDLEHLLTTVVAFALGLVLLSFWLPAEGSARRRALGIAAAAFVPLMFAIGLLMPSLAGAQYLFEIGLKKPEALTLKSASYVEGRYERWYVTDLDKGDAMSSVAASFRSPPVSVWPDADGAGLTGLILGYRMEVRHWKQGSPAPMGAGCSTELTSCVRISVQRATS